MVIPTKIGLDGEGQAAGLEPNKKPVEEFFDGLLVLVLAGSAVFPILIGKAERLSQEVAFLRTQSRYW